MSWTGKLNFTFSSIWSQKIAIIIKIFEISNLLRRERKNNIWLSMSCFACFQCSLSLFLNVHHLISVTTASFEPNPTDWWCEADLFSRLARGTTPTTLIEPSLCTHHRIGVVKLEVLDLWLEFHCAYDTITIYDGKTVISECNTDLISLNSYILAV